MKHEDELVFSINQVAKMLKVVPGTIRNWEKQGLFNARRTESNYRAYNFDDIILLKKIKEYSIDKRLSHSVIKGLMYMHLMESRAIRNEAGDSSTYSRKLLSLRWREFRDESGYTLEEVGKAVGISPSYLSKIETGQANISLEVLNRLAEFYNQHALFFMEETNRDNHLVPKGEETVVDIGLEGVSINSLVAMRGARLKVMMFTVKPGCGNPASHSHFGEEFIHLLEGELEIILDKSKTYRMKAGDTLYFHSSEEHKWDNPGKKTARFIWAFSPLAE